MKRFVIFSANKIDELPDQVNQWLSENPSYQIVLSHISHDDKFYLLIYYREMPVQNFWFIAVRNDIRELVDNRIYFDEKEARIKCDEINEKYGLGNLFKVWEFKKP